MDGKTPNITLHENYFHPISNERAKLNLTCVLNNGSDNKEYLVNIVHSLEGRETILAKSKIKTACPLNMTVVVNVRGEYNGRIWATLDNLTNLHSTALEPNLSPPTIEQNEIHKRNLEQYGLRDDSNLPRNIKPKSYGKFINRDNGPRQVVKRESPPLKEKESKEDSKISDLPQKEEIIIQKHAEHIDVRRSFLNPSAVKGLAYLSVIAATASIPAHFAYKQGLAEAEQVANDVKALSMIPIFDNLDEKNDAVSHISSRAFIPEHIKRWEAESLENTGVKKTADHISWKIQPVSADEFKDGGRLFIARKALTFAEDRLAEKNYGINPYGILRSAVTLKGGGSSIADQLCGATWEQTGKFHSLSSSSRQGIYKLERKWHEVLCGIGLGIGGKMKMEEVFANYFTYVYFGANRIYGLKSYLEEFQGITDLDDPKFTRGQQIVIASLPKRRLPDNRAGSDYQERLDIKWNDPKEGIKLRALYILRGLVEQGIIKDEEEVVREIEAAKPSPKYFHNEDLYTYTTRMSAIELAKYLKKENVNSDEWKLSHSGIVVGIDRKLQMELKEIMTKELSKLGADVRGTVFVVNENGEYKGIFTGSKKGFDNQYLDRRMTGFDHTGKPVESPGSLGKLFGAAGLAQKGLTPSQVNSPLIKRAVYTLSHSMGEFADVTEQLGVNKELVHKLIDCYGDWKVGVKQNAIQAAVSGNWNAQPNALPGFLYAIMTGKDLAPPHFILGDLDYLNNLKAWKYTNDLHDAQCTSMAYQNGDTRKWAALPFSPGGTMNGMQIPPSVIMKVGKTGTANSADKHGNAIDNTTNIEWAPFGVEFSDHSYYMTVTYIRSEYTENDAGLDINLRGNMGNDLLASKNAVPVSSKVLNVLDELK